MPRGKRDAQSVAHDRPDSRVTPVSVEQEYEQEYEKGLLSGRNSVLNVFAAKRHPMTRPPYRGTGPQPISWRQADCCCAAADASLSAHKRAACGYDAGRRSNVVAPDATAARQATCLALFTLSLLIAAFGPQGFAGMPEGTRISALDPGEVDTDNEAERELEGLFIATGRTLIEIPLERGKDNLVISGKTGPGTDGIRIEFYRGEKRDSRGRIIVWPHYILKAADWRADAEDPYAPPFPEGCGESLPDAYLTFYQCRKKWATTHFFIRPDLNYYGGDRRRDLIAGWAALPAASDHLFHLEIRNLPGEKTQLWLNGRFIQRDPNELGGRSPVKSVKVTLPAGARIADIRWEPVAEAGDFLPLRLAYAGTAADMPVKGASIESGPRVIPSFAGKRIPELGSRGGKSVSRGEKSAETREIEAGFVDESFTTTDIPLVVAPASQGLRVGGLGRLNATAHQAAHPCWEKSSLIGAPESVVFSVPQALYHTAYILCAITGPAEARPAFTVRMTRFGEGSKGDLLGDVLVDFSDSEIEKSKERGAVATDEGGRSVPLWLVRVPLPMTEVHDIVQEKSITAKMALRKVLDVELMDPVEGLKEAEAFPPLTHAFTRTRHPAGPQSSVRLYAVTLEKSPLHVRVKTVPDSGPFEAGLTAGYRIQVESKWVQKNLPSDGAKPYVVAWDFVNAKGEVVTSEKKATRLTRIGWRQKLAIPVEEKEGWYAARIRVLRPDGYRLFEHHSQFVVAGKAAIREGTIPPSPWPALRPVKGLRKAADAKEPQP